MAASLLFLLLVSACTAELGFQPKRQYTYLYEAKQSSGIPGLQSQWSALGMKIKVKIQVPTEGNLYVKLESIEQGELKNVYTYQQWRKNLKIPYSPVDQEELSRVFMVELKGGVIKRIITTQGEPIWVVNIKKSIAQMFQLDMKNMKPMDVLSTMQLSGYQRGQQAESFRSMEKSIGGECETLYETTPHLPQGLKADMLHELKILSHSSLPDIAVPDFDRFQPFIVTKTKNYQNCRSRPNWQHMTPGAVSCRSDDCYLTASNRSTTARYVLDGDRSSFQIQYVVAESEALMFPYDYETEQLWTVTNQTLFLQQAGKMESFFGELPHPKSYEKLAFQYPTADNQELRMPDLKSAPQLSTYVPGAPVQAILSQQTPEQLMAIVTRHIYTVDKLLDHVPDPVQEDVTGYIVEMERALSWLSYDQLNEVFRRLTHHRQEDVYWDTLALTGTNPAVMKIVDAINGGHIENDRIASILVTLPLNIKTPTYQLVDQLVQLFKSPVLHPQKSMKSPRMTMALSLGNIFYQICISNTTVQHSYTQGLYPQPFCSNETKALLKEQFIPFLEKKIKETQEPEKLAYIQALGNTGDVKIISILSNLITKEKNPLVATKAIYALYRVIAKHPEQGRKLGSLIFHDVTRPTSVRLAAVTMLLVTNPPIAYWQKIATSTWYEPSDAVAALIHSAYSTMANITFAQQQPLFEMSRRARSTLPLIRPPQGGFGFSGSYSFNNGQVIPQYQVAALSHLGIIASNTSVIPSAIYMEFQHYFNSVFYSGYRWHLNVQGGQRLIDNIMGINSDSSFRRQSPRDLSAKLKQLGGSLKSLRSQEPEKFQATLYTQLMGAIDAFIVFDEDSYNVMLDKIRHNNGWSEQRVQKIAYLEDTTVTFPSEIGLPIIYSKKTPIVASARGNMSVTWSWKSGQYNATMENVQKFIAVKNLVTVSTISPFSLRALGAGVENKAQLSLPMSLKVRLDLSAKKLQVEVETVQQPSPVKVAHIQMRPFTTAAKVTTYENLVTSSDTKEITTSRKSNIMFPFGKEVGVDGYLRVVSDNPIVNFGTFWTEFMKRGTVGVTNLWFMMGSLRSRHYDIVIDTSNSSFSKLQTTFEINHPDDQDTKEMVQSMLTNQQYASQVRSTSQGRMPLMQGPVSLQQGQTGVTRYVANATFALKSGTTLPYNAQLTLIPGTETMPTLQLMKFLASKPGKNVCLEAGMLFPRMSDNREELLRTNVEAPVWTKLGYGSDCHEHNLDIEGHIRRDKLATEYARTCPEAQRCIQHESRGNPNSADCRLAKDYAALVNFIDLKFTEHNPSTYFKNVSYSLDFFAKYMLWPYMSSDYFVENPRHKVNIKMQLHPYKNGMNLTIVKPSENTKFEGVPLPFNMLYEPGLLTMRKSIHKKIVDNLYGVDKTVCLFDSMVVKTYDNVTLESVPTDCWTLLTGDSSGISDMAVYGKVANHQSGVQIIVNGVVIEMFTGSLNQVMVDGQRKSLSDVSEVNVLDNTSGKISVKVKMLAGDTVKVMLPEDYVEVWITKEGIQIHASLLAYRDRLRGVCGNFDGEQKDDMEALSGCVYKDGQKFYESYRKKDGQDQCKPVIPHEHDCVFPSAQGSQSHG